MSFSFQLIISISFRKHIISRLERLYFTDREDEDSYMEPYTGNEWIYIGELEESHVWKRPDSRDGDDESSEGPIKDRRGSQGSTESEKGFQKKYQAATHRMVHRKSSGEMYKRIQSKSFGEHFNRNYASNNPRHCSSKHHKCNCLPRSWVDRFGVE